MKKMMRLALTAAILLAAEATSASLPATQLARTSGAFGILTYDPAYTYTTPVPVPCTWLHEHDANVADEPEAYEAAAFATAANGRKVWTCYALGLDPTVPSDDFRITRFWMDGDKPMFEYSHTTDGSGKSFEEYINKLGKAKLTDNWQLVPADGNPAFRFFTVEVVFPGGTSIAVSGDEDVFPDETSVAVSHDKIQLWEDGPYWATTNIGAENPEDNGYYFWWGDTVGYRREGKAWVATDGSSSNFSFEAKNAPTYGKSIATLQSEGWITSDGVLAPEHDAAQAQWGDDWRMPTKQEFDDLNSNCDWTWTTQNGVNGYIVRGRGAYSSNFIFLPCTGFVDETSLYSSGSSGDYRSSVPGSSYSDYYQEDEAYELYFISGYHSTGSSFRPRGLSVRPVQGFTK